MQFSFTEEQQLFADSVRVPVIASGGVGNLDDLVAGVKDGHATAVLAASIFHFGTYSVGEAKRYMADRGIAMRRLRPGLLGGEPYVVAAAVWAEPGDLAALLRSVQTFVEEESLYAIRFMLDNEIYVMAADEWKTPSFLIPVEEIDEVDEIEETPRAA